MVLPQFCRLGRHPHAGRLVCGTTLLAGSSPPGGGRVRRTRQGVHAERGPARPGPVLTLAMLLPLVLVCRGVSASKHPECAAVPAALRWPSHRGGAPSDTGERRDDDCVEHEASPRSSTVASGFIPTGCARRARSSPASRKRRAPPAARPGRRSVVVIKSKVAGTPFAAAADVEVAGSASSARTRRRRHLPDRPTNSRLGERAENSEDGISPPPIPVVPSRSSGSRSSRSGAPSSTPPSGSSS